jgi:hypoxanthine phosphoribosyltransferase
MQKSTNSLSSDVPSHTPDKNVIIDNKDIQEALATMAVKLNDAYKDDAPIMLCVVNGGIVFTGQLLPLLNFPLILDYVHVSRYKNNQAGELVWKQYPSKSVKNRNVVILDDVLDSGVTITAIKDWCMSEGAKKVETVVLLEKDIPRSDNAIQTADFSALSIGKAFVYGFGLDNEDYWRNTKDIYVVK